MLNYSQVRRTKRFEEALDSLARANAREQTRVERIITLYLTDISALTRTPLRSARRDVMHTRVSHDIRIVDCASTERPDAVILLYIDHHDIANRWGTEYEGDADCEPVVAEINGNLTRPTMHSPPMLGETLTERLLLSRGIPTELIAPIQRMTPDELNESDQFDEQTINSVLSWYRATRRTKAIPIPLPNIGPQQPVTVAQNDVASVSRIPLSKFLARLTPEQQRLVTRRAKGIMAVRGAAGSGKTIVGIRRLVALLEQRELTETKPVLYTCHNRVLATVAESLLRERVENGETRNLIQVTTTYGLMIDELQKRVSDPLPKRAGKERLLPLLTEARELTGRARSLVAWSDAELLTEIIEIIYGRVLLRLSDYAQADRRGVGHAHRLTVAARGDVWDVYAKFRELCARHGLAPWAWVATKLASLLDADPVKEPCWSAVVIDEVQDLSPAAVRVIYQLQARRDQNFIILGDGAQAIYLNGFRWCHLGMEIKPANSHTLTSTFRSTRQIIGAAIPLLDEVAERLEEDLVRPAGCASSGPQVRVHEVAGLEDEIQEVALIIDFHVQSGAALSSIGVLLQTTQSQHLLMALLSSQGIPFETAYKKDESPSINPFDASVKLMLASTSKGLEFPILVVMSVHESNFPTLSVDSDSRTRSHKALYVAMTRCAFALHLTCVSGVRAAILDSLDSRFVVNA